MSGFNMAADIRDSTLCTAAVTGALFVFAAVVQLATVTRSQVAWTPIFVDGSSQVDLWTLEATGCACAFDPARSDCACCVKDGGCPCDRSAPHRCIQCGLEQHCAHMCNVTLDARFLMSRSGKTFGQIKSPSLEGPAFCWFLFQPDAGQRVEVQVYRLVSVGRFNGSSCEGGFLQLVEGKKPSANSSGIQICGGNERFSPPVVLFADNGPASLLFHISETSYRSQFLAFYSFTKSNYSANIGFPARGGRRINATKCDWLYHDYLCRQPGYCILASANYPGLYPPNRKCKYYITTTNPETSIHINFTSFLLPYNQCKTHFIAVYQGDTTSTKPLKILCKNRKHELTFFGHQLLIEFSSGATVPPYDYNGFLATLEFIDPTTSTELTTRSTARSTQALPLVNKNITTPRPTQKPGCDQIFHGNITRSGHFDTKDKPWSPACTIKFIGRSVDIVHISLFNYHLSAPGCQTEVEIIDGLSGNVEIHHRICSPITRNARDSYGRFVSQQTFVSSKNTYMLVMKRLAPASSTLEEEYISGAFLFHDEQMEGTLRPDTLCDVDFYGSSSIREGRVTNPGNHQLYWNLDGSFRCLQRFVPAANQSLELSVTTFTGLSTDPNCRTECGEGGCHCVTDSHLSDSDHLSFVTDEGQVVSCVCGMFQQKWLPITLRSWTSIKMVYTVANYSWMQGFSYHADYSFVTDGVCGYSLLISASGEVTSRRLNSTTENSNYYFHQECVWLLDPKIESQITIEIFSFQNSSCALWNITIYKYDEQTIDNFGDVLMIFCPRDRSKELSLPSKVNTVILRLRATTSLPPEYTIRWRSPSDANTPTDASLATFGREQWIVMWFILYPIAAIHCL